MNKSKLANRTTLALAIRDRYSPRYRVIDRHTGATIATAETRDDARTAKRPHGVGARIERRADDLRAAPDYRYESAS